MVSSDDLASGFWNVIFRSLYILIPAWHWFWTSVESVGTFAWTWLSTLMLIVYVCIPTLISFSLQRSRVRSEQSFSLIFRAKLQISQCYCLVTDLFLRDSQTQALTKVLLSSCNFCTEIRTHTHRVMATVWPRPPAAAAHDEPMWPLPCVPLYLSLSLGHVCITADMRDRNKTDTHIQAQAYGCLVGYCPNLKTSKL